MRQQLTDNDATKAVAVYLRKSRKDKALEDNGIDTLERHEKILTDLAAQQGLTIGEIYKEVVSGDSIESRPEMQRLLEDVHNNRWSGVLVVELERLARGDTKDQGIVAEAFKYSETLIITPSKTYDPNDEFDEEYFEFGLFMSRREYKTIKRRLAAGVQLSVLEGNFIHPTAPFGYDIVDGGRRNRTLKANSDAKYVKMMFEWFALDKVPICEIARRLTDIGVQSPTGLNYWSAHSIKKMLCNETYIGKIHYGKSKKQKEYIDGRLQSVYRSPENYTVADGKHDAIIDMDLWELAQTRHALNAPVKADKQLANPLAGLLTCPKCGHALRYMQAKKNGKAYPKFAHRSDSSPCRCSSAAVHAVVQAVIDALEGYIADFQVQLADNGVQEAKTHVEIIAAMESNLETLKAKRKKLMIYFEDEIYTEDEFLERKKDINDEITLLTARLEVAKETAPPEVDYSEMITKFSRAVELLQDPNATAKTKNDYLKEIICRIDYTRESRYEPFSLAITLI